jgi:glucose/mannose transport system permease protein
VSYTSTSESTIPKNSLGRQQIAVRVGVYAFLASAAIFFVIPLYVMLVTSFKTIPELRSGSMLALPASINLDAWVTAWSSACTGLDCRGISPGFFNSLKIVIPSLILSIGLGAINGYALALWKFPGADRVAALITLGLFIPYQVVMFPIVQIFSAIGLQGSLASIVAVHILFGLPFMTMLFRNFYASLPVDLVRAAVMDGGGFWTILRYIMLPLSANVGIVAMIWQFTGIWNDFLLGLIFAGRNNVPMTVQLNNIVNVTLGEVQYNVNMAATLLTAIPPLIIYFVSGKYFVRGVTAGATKG